MHDRAQLVVTFVPSFLRHVFTRPFYEPRTKAKGVKKKKKKKGGGNDEVLMERVGDYY